MHHDAIGQARSPVTPRPAPIRVTAWLAALAAALVTTSGCGSPATGLPPAPASSASATAAPATAAPATATPSGPNPWGSDPPGARGTAQAGLAALTVKGRAAKTGYSRAAFGSPWADVDHNGCDTRDDILRRDLVSVVVAPGTRGCQVTSGILHDPYTGASIGFRRGPNSAVIQIDHVVALSNAWQTGAAAWSAGRRLAYANDPLVLLAVSGAQNQAKGDADAATWLPQRAGYRCDYVARQVAIKLRYRLWVTPAEHKAISRVLATCPGRLLPS